MKNTDPKSVNPNAGGGSVQRLVSPFHGMRKVTTSSPLVDSIRRTLPRCVSSEPGNEKPLITHLLLNCCMPVFRSRAVSAPVDGFLSSARNLGMSPIGYRAGPSGRKRTQRTPRENNTKNLPGQFHRTASAELLLYDRWFVY